MAENSPVTYQYISDKLSVACVRHVFLYLSAISGIKFIEDKESPSLVSNSGHAVPESARVLFHNEKQNPSKTQIRDASSCNWLTVINFDPVDVLATKLTLKGKSGPYSSKPISPSGPGEKTLSALITEFVNVLIRAGLFENRPQAITLWPESARFGMAATHDIDIAHRSVAGSLRLLLNRALPGGWGGLFDSIKAVMKIVPNPYNMVGKWIDLEKKLDLKSTYFIFDGQRRHPFDPKYKPKMLSNAFEKLSQNGHEIALHSSVECYSGSGISEAKSRLEQSAEKKLAGLRPHYLSAFFPDYWSEAAEAGFTYSSALGFDNDTGYREGIDLPFCPFDSAMDSAIPLVEIPIAIMDCGLIGELPATSDGVLERAMRLVDSASSTGGLIVLDWHQRTFYNRDYPGWSELFTKIVHYARGKGACFFRMDELATDFMKRLNR